MSLRLRTLSRAKRTGNDLYYYTKEKRCAVVVVDIVAIGVVVFVGDGVLLGASVHAPVQCGNA